MGRFVVVGEIRATLLLQYSPPLFKSRPREFYTQLEVYTFRMDGKGKEFGEGA